MLRIFVCLQFSLSPRNTRIFGSFWISRNSICSFPPNTSGWRLWMWFFHSCQRTTGCVNRLEGCLPSHSNPPIVQEVSGFSVHGKTFQYKVLPFGLKDSPWVFMRVVATLVGHLRRLGLRLFYYLDDWLLVAESRDLLETHLRTILQWNRDLGFLVNWKKSSLTPQRLPSYLGAQLDIPRLLARPLEHRVLALQEVILDLIKGPLATASRVAEISRPPCQLRGPSPQLQAADEASSASSSAVFHPLGRSSGAYCIKLFTGENSGWNWKLGLARFCHWL